MAVAPLRPILPILPAHFHQGILTPHPLPQASYPRVPIMAVTATATDHVAADILKTLGMTRARVFKVWAQLLEGGGWVRGGESGKGGG